MTYQDLQSREIIGRLFMAISETAPSPMVQDIAMLMPTNSAENTYRWLSDLPALRKWEGGRHAKRMDVNEQIVRNEKFEMTLEFLRSELRRDSLGQITLRIQEASARAAQHWSKLVVDTLEANATAYDGVAFFGANHDGIAENDNHLTPAMAGTTPTVAEFEAAVIDGIAAMLNFRDSAGEPMNSSLSQLLVLVPPSLFAVAQRAINDQVITDGSGTRTNTLANLAGYGIRLAVEPRLSLANTFYMTRSDSPAKPLIIQEEYLEVDSLAEGSDFSFEFDAHRYGIHTSRACGNGIPLLALRQTFA